MSAASQSKIQQNIWSLTSADEHQNPGHRQETPANSPPDQPEADRNVSGVAGNAAGWEFEADDRIPVAVLQNRPVRRNHNWAAEGADFDSRRIQSAGQADQRAAMKDSWAATSGGKLLFLGVGVPGLGLR